MGREKSTRNLSFKPIVNSFIPENKEYTGVSSLLHEEIEAIYLMDILGLYQAQAAKSMGVSRTTFTRILKNARLKVATALVSGYKIDIEDSKEDITIAFCSNNTKTYEKIDPLQEYIHIYHIDAKDINLIKTIKNPVYIKKAKPAIILPQILLENKVNLFISSQIGEGLKNSLQSKGIRPMVKKEIDLNLLKEMNSY